MKGVLCQYKLDIKLKSNDFVICFELKSIFFFLHLSDGMIIISLFEADRM